MSCSSLAASNGQWRKTPLHPELVLVFDQLRNEAAAGICQPERRTQEKLSHSGSKSQSTFAG